MLSRLFRQPVWWRYIHLSFVPAALLLHGLGLPAWIYLSGFFLLLLIFWGTVKGDVPLFLSGSAASEVLADIIEREHAESLIDLGAGLGSVIIPIAKRFPKLNIIAVERAPIPYLILSWRCRFITNIKVRRDNFWNCNLADYDMVFAFLSPSVMERLGHKCRNEINERALLVSSRFPLPKNVADFVIERDSGDLKFYCYRFGEIPGDSMGRDGLARS